MDRTLEKKFVIPYVDQDEKFWQKICSLYCGQIREVYFPIMDDFIATGRPKQPERYLKDFLESKILTVSVLINPVVLIRPVEELRSHILKKLEYYIENYNISGVTLSNLTLASIIKKEFPSLELFASTLMEICSKQQLVYLNDIFTGIVPSTKIIRDIKSLRDLRANYTGRIRLMVNESCLMSCLLRTQHFFEMSKPDIVYPESLCSDLLDQKPWLRLTGGWILPQHLFLFDGLYDEIKLSGRISLQQPDRYLKVFDSYLHERPLSADQIGGGPASVNCPVDIGVDFYKYTLECSKNCGSCSVCADYWEVKTGKYA
jgi:hypothetical protein